MSTPNNFFLFIIAITPYIYYIVTYKDKTNDTYNDKNVHYKNASAQTLTTSRQDAAIQTEQHLSDCIIVEYCPRV